MEKLTVHTPCGDLTGLGQESWWEFRGVPYARPPVGALRWHAPKPMEGWEGTWDATAFRPMGPQADIRDMALYGKEFYDDDAYFPGQSEDCLYLNIWCPPVEEGSKLPVAIWIHGGSFDHGASCEKEFDGAAYAKRGVILVSIAYRLGALGFLASPERMAEDGFAGNYGHLDQLEAVRWVKRNIAAFGGDPDNITLFGQSAGSFSVQNLLSMPEAPRLIRRAILQSGVGTRSVSPLAAPERAYELCARLMDKVGAQDMKGLEAVHAEALLAATNEIAKETGGMVFTPVADGVTLKAVDGPFPLPAEDGLKVLIGATRDDIAAADGSNPFLEGAKAYAARPRGGEAYVYHFAHDLPGSDDGCFHSSELWYTFGTLGRCWRPMTEADYALSEKMVDYWTNFMRTGDPNGPGLPRWEAYPAGGVMEFT